MSETSPQTDKRPTLYLIDGSAYIYRAFFALPALNNSKGLQTNAVYGFMTTLLKIIREHGPDGLVVAFDEKGPTLRHEEFKEYKAQRPPMPDGMKAQTPYIHRVVEAFGIPVVRKQGYRIIGKRVNAKTVKGLLTDIDILAVRDGFEGEEMRRALNNLRSERDALDPEDAARRTALTRQIAQIEQEYILCVEVKWGDGKLSKSQKDLYSGLEKGTRVEIVTDLHDPGSKSVIIEKKTPFSARPLVVTLLRSRRVHDRVRTAAGRRSVLRRVVPRARRAAPRRAKATGVRANGRRPTPASPQPR